MPTLVITIIGKQKAIQRLLRVIDNVIEPLKADVPTEILALQQALDTVQWLDQGAQITLDHPIAWVAAARLTSLARGDNLRTVVRTADLYAIHAHEQVAYLGEWRSVLDGRCELRGVVWQSAAGFHPAIETSTYNRVSDPPYGNPVPTLNAAIAAAEKLVDTTLMREVAEPLDQAGAAPQP